MSHPTPTRILILGGGFGGVYAALELMRAHRPDRPLHITLVNRDNFFLFTPMLHEVAASDLDFTHIVNPLRKLLPGVHLFHGDVDSIDLATKRVTVSHGSDHHDHEIEYDHLILGFGSVTNFFGLPGLAERAITMKSLGDAIHLRNRAIAHLEEANFECGAHNREPLLRVVVAGGGFAGVETVGALHDFLEEAVRFYPNLDVGAIRMTLVHPGEVILPELGPELGAYAQRKLIERGIDVRTRTRVTGVTADGVALSDGTSLATRTLVWTAGTSPHPLLATLPVTCERGRVRVNAQLEVAEWPGVWAVGDCASIPDPATGGACPPTAQHAIRQGTLIARNILATIAGRPRRAFAFRGLGQLAAIGKRTGVARVFGLQFSGFLAWWLWRTVYLSKLPRAEKKMRVMLDWTLDLIFAKDLVHFETARSFAYDSPMRVMPETVGTAAVAPTQEVRP
ncbi:MAG: NAD(P)/FAD-dependent oxidoreductase [Candidatus Eisenbacteria bacterium]|uniref:NADH:ubiquinone reductase (non-electrogenic) n=1 Tax=Eiseniibacteriota bacterium TaxID=2212470 RepID=A0A849SM63_UNCEI|nr:NAD(P)/FAD-dependent oxidoreductase [Candidatus Eisenbacteria bacterium]